MIAVSIRYFASVREALGTRGETLQTTARTVGELRDELLARHGAFAQALARGQALRVAVNQHMADEGTALSQGCEVAFFPPVTGG